MRLRRSIRRFTQVDSRRRALVVEAVACLLLARLALVFVPFQRLARHLGTFVAPAKARLLQDSQAISPQDVALAREIGWAVTRAARHVPFKAVCLPQAMAARVMLKRRGVASVMHFGAGKGENNRLDAHAWLDAAGVEVTGYPLEQGFPEIGCFV
jgi:hypothetical protein